MVDAIAQDALVSIEDLAFPERSTKQREFIQFKIGGCAPEAAEYLAESFLAADALREEKVTVVSSVWNGACR